MSWHNITMFALAVLLAAAERTKSTLMRRAGRAAEFVYLAAHVNSDHLWIIVEITLDHFRSLKIV